MTNKKIIQGDSKSLWDWIVLSCLFFAAYASMASDSLNSIALYVALPIAFVLSFLFSKSLFPNKYQCLLYLLFIWEAISLLWAYYPDLTRRELRSILGVIMLSYIVSIQAARPKMIVWLYLMYLLLYLGAWNYASSNMLIVTDFSSAERMNDEKLNANTMAYYTFYVTYALFILDEIVKSNFWKKVFRYLFLLMIPLSFLVAFTTASRQVLIIQIPLFVLLLWLRYIQGGTKTKKYLFLLVTTVVLVVFIPKVLSIYKDSFLAERASVKVSDDARSVLVKEAIEVGLNHFPLGVGAGNYIMFSQSHHFSHNSFTELFANTGIIGLLIYTVLLFTFLNRQWERFRKTRDRMFLLFLVFGLMFLLDQVFYVFYIDLWLISFFILVSTNSESYYYSNYLSQSKN